VPIPNRRGLGAVYIALSGGCVGFLAGLSVSPVAGALLSAITALVVGITGTLAGVQVSGAGDSTANALGPRITVNALPVALLLMGMVAGSVIGVATRTHNWLGVPTADKQQSGNVQSPGVLYSARTSECSEWRAIEAENPLKENLIASETIKGNSKLSNLVQACDNKQCLDAVVELLCSN